MESIRQILFLIVMTEKFQKYIKLRITLDKNIYICVIFSMWKWMTGTLKLRMTLGEYLIVHKTDQELQNECP